jgi:hypothetical protein
VCEQLVAILSRKLYRPVHFQKLFGAKPGCPFMEHPSGDFDFALAAGNHAHVSTDRSNAFAVNFVYGKC